MPKVQFSWKFNSQHVGAGFWRQTSPCLQKPATVFAAPWRSSLVHRHFLDSTLSLLISGNWDSNASFMRQHCTQERERGIARNSTIYSDNCYTCTRVTLATAEVSDFSRTSPPLRELGFKMLLDFLTDSQNLQILPDLPKSRCYQLVGDLDFEANLVFHLRLLVLTTLAPPLDQGCFSML